MENIELTDNGKKLAEFLDLKMNGGAFTNNDLLHFLEQVGRYLNLQTIPDYAKEHSMTYNGVKSGRDVQEIFGVKFIIDNE